MSNDQSQWNFPGATPGGAYQWPPHQWPPNGWGAAGPGWAGPQGAGPGPQQGSRRIDALDVLEGVLQDGLSVSNLTRIARASGSNFWIGAAIGAGLVVLMNRPDMRESLGKVFGAGASARGPAAPGKPPAP